MLSQELDNLTCQELQNRVYNTSEPPIQLSDYQMIVLLSSFPQSFKEPVNETSGSIFQCDEGALSPLTKRKRRQSNGKVRVCSAISDYRIIHLALDKHGETVLVPQLGLFNLVQEFTEELCSEDTCSSNLQCQCQNQLSHTAKSVVAYIKRRDPKFYESEIQLQSCSAYILY
ncbi:uncharacterized protein LOC117122860 isoform X2 [Anneissia japonica]|nr:uncharacterized protein LOC117122860 isoform X2 [Anneissia japonica]